VKLSAAGHSDIVASHVASTADGRSVTATLPLSGAAEGLWDVDVTNSAGVTSVLHGAFTITGAKPAFVSVGLAGAPSMSPGGQWTGLLTYQNLGNVDAHGTLVLISGVPAGALVRFDGLPSLPSEAPSADGTTVIVGLPDIQPYGSGAIGLRFTATGPIHTFLYLQPQVLVHSVPADEFRGDPSVRLSSNIAEIDSRHLRGTIQLSSTSTSGDVTFSSSIVPAPRDGVPRVRVDTSREPWTFSSDAPLVAPSPPSSRMPSSCPSSLCIYTRRQGNATAAGAPAHRLTPDAVAHAAGVGSWISNAWNAVNNIWNSWKGSNQAVSTQEAANAQKAISACLGGPGKKYLTADQVAQLDKVADASVSAQLVALALSLSGKAGGVLQTEAADALSTVASSQWFYLLSRDLHDNNDGDPNNPFGFNPYTGTQQANTYLLAQVLKVCPPPPPPTPKCKAKKSQDETVSPSRKTSHRGAPPPPPPPPDFGECNPPPPPPAFPIQFLVSGDPNDMSGPPGPGAGHFVSSRVTPYRYTAHFENEPTASGAAWRVTVTDKIPADVLQRSSLTLGPVTVAGHIATPPPSVQQWDGSIDLRPRRNVIVDVSGRFDPVTSVLSWKFTTVNASTGVPITDPTNGFLPPDNGAGDGEGSVTFTVAPRPGLGTGTRIANSAQIVFDTNAPIDTPVWLNTIDRSSPRSRIKSVRWSTVRVRARRGNRATGRRVGLLEIRWSASDRGSGAAVFDLFAAVGAGRFRQVLFQFPRREVTFVCKPGRRYRFRVRAIDAAGNVQRGRGRMPKPVRCH
jgi:hypothetical protein